MKNDDDKLSLRIDQAKWWMIKNHPFYGQLIDNLENSFDDGVKTAITNGVRIRWNRKHLSSLTDEQVRYVLAKAALRCGHQHLWRLPANKIGNKASHFALEKVMRGLDGIKPPPGTDTCPKEFDNFAEEEIFLKLKERAVDEGKDKGDGPGGGDQEGTGDPSGDFESPPENKEGDNKNKEQKEQKEKKPRKGKGNGNQEGEGEGESQNLKDSWDQIFIQAAQCTQAAAGTIPADMQRRLDRMRHQPIDWKQETAEFIKDRIVHRNDWSRCARRHSWRPVFYPRRKQDEVGKIVFVRDTSGSINDTICAQFSALISNCLADTNCSGLVWDCDAHLQAEYELQPGDECPNTAKGGGGTDFRPVMDKLKKLIEAGEVISGLVYLTDMYTSSFGEDPGCPVLWLSTTEIKEAPFGRVVPIEVTC